MRYMVMLTRGVWEDTGTEDERQRAYGEIREWWAGQVAQGKIIEGQRLQPADTSTTLVLRHGEARLIDGPFMETKETIGGYAIVDVADLDEAIAMFRGFPCPDGKAEIRPVVE